MKTTIKHPENSSLISLSMPEKSSKQLVCLLVCLLLAFTIAAPDINARSFTSTGIGSQQWNNASSWTFLSGSGTPAYPIAGDTAIINAGHDIILTANAACSSVEIKFSGTVGSGTSSLNIGNFNLTTSALTINGGSTSGGVKRKAKLEIGNGTLIVNGNLNFTGTTANTAIEFADNSVGVLKITGDLDSDGDINYGLNTNTTFVFNGISSQTIPMAYNYNNVHFDNPTGVTPDNAITKIDDNDITGDIVILSGIFNNGGHKIEGAAGAKFEVKAGATFIASGTTSFPDFPNKILASGSTVKYAGTAQSVAALPYSNLIIDGSGTKTLRGSITPTGNVTVQAGIFHNNDKKITGTAGKYFEVKESATFITTRTGSSAFPSGFTNVNLADGSTVEYNSNSSQTIASESYGNLLLSGTGAKILKGNTTIRKTLDLANESIELGDNNLKVKATGSIIHADATNYIKQTGAGKLIMEDLGIDGITSEVLFPIGTGTSYTPAYITNYGPKNNFSVRVEDGVKDNNNTAVTNNVVMKTWNVEQQTTNGTANVTLKLQWNSSDQGTPFDLTQVGISHNHNGSWQRPATYVAATGSNPYQVTLSGISSFSPFSVGDIISPLPVELISFKATNKGNFAFLQWETASEKDNQGFTIQNSLDGLSFEDIGFVASQNPNSNSLLKYEFLDKTAAKTGLQYYRLKQTDLNGTVAFSPIKVLNFNLQQENPLIYPNPFNHAFSLNIQSDKDDLLTYEVVDLAGKTVYQSTEKLTKGNNTLKIDLDKELPSGLYLICTQTCNGTASARLIKQ